MGVWDVVVAVARDDGGRKAVSVSLQDAREAPKMHDPVIARTIPRVSEQGRLRVRAGALLTSRIFDWIAARSVEPAACAARMISAAAS